MSMHDTSAEQTNGGLGVPGVRPRGAEGPDVTFTDDSGTPVFRRQVSTSNGRYSDFENEVRSRARQVNGRGEVFVQMPDSVDAATAKGRVDRFCATRCGPTLHTHAGVTVRFVSRAGAELGSYPLGQRMPQHGSQEVGDE
jgi:hypothetical protein